MSFNLKSDSFFIVYCCGFLFLSACNYSQKLISYVEPAISIVDEHDLFATEVSVFFVIDGSGSMSAERKYLVNNVHELSKLLEDADHLDYNFALSVMRKYNTNSRYDQKMLIVHPDLLKGGPSSLCIHNSSENFIQESIIGPFFRFTKEDIAEHASSTLFCFISKSMQALPIERGAGGPHDFRDSPRSIELANEFYFSPIRNAIEQSKRSPQDQAFEKFFGSSSQLIIIFISDAGGDGFDRFMKDRRVNGMTAGRIYGDDFYNMITSYKDPDKIRFYGIVPIDKKTDCKGQSDYEETTGAPYHAIHLVKKTRGKVVPVCDENWGDHINLITKDLNIFLKQDRFFLNRIPDMESLEVFHEGVKIKRDVESGWYYDPESVSVIFSRKIIDQESFLKNSKVTIKYHPINSEIISF